MEIFSRFRKRNKTLAVHDMVKPYFFKAREAILAHELPLAIAYLDQAVKLAPDCLELYLQRAQIQQYGLENCAEALSDYRFILRELEARPDEQLAGQCRRGMKDMMVAANPESQRP